jgi:hypothetical protein
MIYMSPTFEANFEKSKMTFDKKGETRNVGT